MKPRYRFVERLTGPPGHDGVYVFEMSNHADIAANVGWGMMKPYERELVYADRFWGDR